MNDPTATAAVAPVVVRLDAVGLRYGKTVALDAITLDIPAGCMVGLIGPDGVGKASLLSLIAGACTMSEASIIGAQVFSMRDGPALDTFRLRRAFTSDDDEKVRATRIIETTKQLLQGKRTILIDLGKESRHNRRLKPFSLPAEVQVSNTLSEKFTVIEVSGLDRNGLLHQLTSAISDLNLTIGSAHIGTYGEKAVDVFYVTDLTGHKIEGKLKQRKIRDALLAVFDQPHDAHHAPVTQKVANG